MNFYKIKTQQKNNEIDTLLKGRIFSAAKKVGVYTDFTWFFVCLFVFLKGEMWRELVVCGQPRFTKEVTTWAEGSGLEWKQGKGESLGVRTLESVCGARGYSQTEPRIDR